jgi:hypothetical protein
VLPVRNCAELSVPRLSVGCDDIPGETGTDMIVDCDRCEVRGDACAECVITVLLGTPPGELELDRADRRALDTLAAAGMVPPLQLVAREGGDAAGRAVIVTEASRHVDAERSLFSAQRSESRAG